MLLLGIIWTPKSYRNLKRGTKNQRVVYSSSTTESILTLPSIIYYAECNAFKTTEFNAFLFVLGIIRESA